MNNIILSRTNPRAVMLLESAAVPIDFEPDEFGNQNDVSLELEPPPFFYPLSMHEVDENEGDDWIEESIDDGDHYIPNFDQRVTKFENYAKDCPISRLEKLDSSDLQAVQV